MMNNTYHRNIVELLLERGKEGMKLTQIVQRVYNLHADLFTKQLKYDVLHHTIGFYLWKQSQRRESPFTRNAYGVYAIKPDVAIQLDFFIDIKTGEEEELKKAAMERESNHLQMELFAE